MTIQIYYIDKKIPYTGTELRSHWIYETTGVLGNALIAFCGPCSVGVDKMVDLEDVRENRPIKSESMLHFIGEFYEKSLAETILFQRLLISLIQQKLIKESGVSHIGRQGNDLFERDKKLTVSIATVSPTSTLIHAAINIISKKTPVPTKGLADYKIDPAPFGQSILDDFQKEFEGLARDLAKVRSVT